MGWAPAVLVVERAVADSSNRGQDLSCDVDQERRRGWLSILALWRAKAGHPAHHVRNCTFAVAPPRRNKQSPWGGERHSPLWLWERPTQQRCSFTIADPESSISNKIVIPWKQKGAKPTRRHPRPGIIFQDLLDTIIS